MSPHPAKSHSLQTIYFQQYTRSFPQRRQPIPRSFNHFRTLLPLTASFFQVSFLPPPHKPFLCRFLFSFQQLAASLRSPKKSTPLESNKCSLFLQNTGGVGWSRFRHSDVQTFGPSDPELSPSLLCGAGGVGVQPHRCRNFSVSHLVLSLPAEAFAGWSLL